MADFRPAQPRLAWRGNLGHLGHELLIQRAEHRDTQAIQAKLDELIHADRGAKDELTHIDRQEPEEIERRRDAD
jgi:low affinity Fe/Cu permease